MRTLKLVEANHPNYRYEVIIMATQTIKLTDKKADFKKDSARALWYGALRKFHGKTPEEFVEAATKKPPALKKDGKPEHPAGWLRYFVKEGMAQLQDVK